MSETADGRYRVVQWATGNIGTRSLRMVIEHPDLELVGLYVHSPAKAGKDAGELSGGDPIGVKATGSIDEIIALRPDCVLYMQEGYNLDDMSRLLEAGANIVTTRSEFHNPSQMDPAMRERLEAACERGGTSLHSTGSSPGFITEAMPLVLTSIQRRLDLLTIDEFADMTSRNSPEMIFQLMGFGQPPESFDPRRAEYIRHSFGPSLELVAEALGLPLDSTEAKGEVATARNDTQIAAGVIKAGTVAAQRMTVTGIRHGKPLLRFRANWYCARDVDPAWELDEAGWRIVVEGDTPMDMRIRFPVEPEVWAATSPGYTAHRPVNAIRYVCEAQPGIRTTVDLPQIIAKLG
jgi:4-hydroxy-tetrahydrodipicolinate reductase